MWPIGAATGISRAPSKLYCLTIPNLKDVLMELVGDLEDLRTSLAVIADRVGTGISLAAAQDAKNLAKQAHAKDYEQLTKKIQALP